jgi:hypothetical protein
VVRHRELPVKQTFGEWYKEGRPVKDERTTKMATRERILGAVRTSKREFVQLPDISNFAADPDDLSEKFENALKRSAVAPDLWKSHHTARHERFKRLDASAEPMAQPRGSV